MATPFINSSKLYTYGPKNALTVFTFAFNHNFHLNQLSLQTITAPYSGVSYWYSYLGSYLRRSKIEWGNFWNNFVGKEWLYKCHNLPACFTSHMRISKLNWVLVIRITNFNHRVISMFAIWGVLVIRML